MPILALQHLFSNGHAVEAALRVSLEVQHLKASAPFSRLVAQVEQQHIGEQFGQFWEEILHLSIASILASVANLEVYARELFFDGSAFRWEIVGCWVAGLAIAGSIVAWPRPALICLGLLFLLLGLLGLSTLKVISIPALVAIIGGIGLIGFGRLVGVVEQLLQETKLHRSSNVTTGEMHADYTSAAKSEPKREPGKAEGRIEPRF